MSCIRPRICSRLIVAFALAGILLAATGCRERCNEGTYRDRCSSDGKAELWCSGRHVYRSPCGGDSVCKEGNGLTWCVDPSLTPCTWGETPRTCAAEGEVVESCTEVDYYVYEECSDREVCVSEGDSAACVVSPLEPCTSRRGVCSPDERTPMFCNASVQYMSYKDPCVDGYVCASNGEFADCFAEPLIPCVEDHCSADGRTQLLCSRAGYVDYRRPCPTGSACAADNDFTTCVDPSFTPCVQSYCGADGRTFMHCSEKVGYVSYVSVCPKRCYDWDPPRHGLSAACSPPSDPS